VFSRKTAAQSLALRRSQVAAACFPTIDSDSPFHPATQAHEDSRELHPSASRHDRGLSEHTRGHYFDWAQSRKIWSWDSLK